MEAKEIKITPPDGYEIDQENSTFNCIKFKPIQKRFRGSGNKIKGYRILFSNTLGLKIWRVDGWESDKLFFATEKQAKSALAMAQIGQIMANDKRFGGVVTDKEWNDKNLPKYCIGRARSSRAMAIKDWEHYYFLAFHTMEQMRLFMSENKDLIKDYFMLD